MNNIESNYDAHAIENEIEILRKEIAKHPENIKKYSTKLSDRALEWIMTANEKFDKLKKEDKLEIVYTLYAYRDKQNKNKERDIHKRKVQVISEMLDATADSKLIEAGNKLLMFSNKFDIKPYDESIEIAETIKTYGSDLTKEYNVKRKETVKTFTVESEIENIRKRTKKIKRKEKRLCKKYKNIHNLYMNIDVVFKSLIKTAQLCNDNDLANKLIRFVEGSNPTIPYDEIKKDIYDLVTNHYPSILNITNNISHFDFIENQKNGKIK